MTAAERAHTKLRLAQRYGLATTSADLFEMAKQVAHGQATFVSRQSKFVAQWLLVYRDQPIRLVFDSRRRAILTALPREDSEAYRQAKAG
jgi:hypothetical protein